MSDISRTDALIESVMRRFPGASVSSDARYYEAVHQELAPLSRELERALAKAKAECATWENAATEWRKDAERRLEQVKAAELRAAASEKRAEANDSLPARVVAMCRARGWSMHWTHRGAYLHLESSELIEAIRGKHGDPMLEAADVLLVLMSITEYAGIPWADVVRQANAKCDELMVKPHYPGEEYSAAIEKESRG